MPRLTSAQKTFIVTELASFATLSEVQAAVKERFEVDVPLSQLSLYDPERSAGATLSAPLRTLFEETRTQTVNELKVVPAAHRAYRVRRLHEMAKKAETRGNIPLAAALLKQVAEEIGGKYVNTISVDLTDDTLRALEGFSAEELEELAGSMPAAGPGHARYDGRVHGRRLISPGVRV